MKKQENKTHGYVEYGTASKKPILVIPNPNGYSGKDRVHFISFVHALSETHRVFVFEFPEEYSYRDALKTLLVTARAIRRIAPFETVIALNNGLAIAVEMLQQMRLKKIPLVLYSAHDLHVRTPEVEDWFKEFHEGEVLHLKPEKYECEERHGHHKIMIPSKKKYRELPLQQIGTVPGKLRGFNYCISRINIFIQRNCTASPLALAA